MPTTRSIQNSARTAALIMAAVVPLCAHAEAATLAFGPAIVLAQNIKPGATNTDIFGTNDFTFVIYNKDKDAGWYNLSIEKPAEGKELGFEPIPDASWCKLDVSEVAVKGESQGKVRLMISVPDKPEYYNRKWTVLVVCAPGKKGADNKPAVGLRVASRLLIETVSKAEGDPTGPAVALWPTVLQSGAVTGALVDDTVKIKNNTDAERTYTVKHLNELEKDAQKYERYFSKGLDPVIATPWITSDAQFKLKPGESRDLKVDVRVPENAEKGKKYEELLFVQDDKGNTNFIRVRTDVTSTTTAQKP